MLRHIAWFNEVPVELRRDGGLTSPHEGVRQRCLAPARELEKLGIECAVFGNLHDADPAQVSQHLQKLNIDIVIVGKMMSVSLLKLARAAKHMGCYIVADICAEDIGNPELATHWRQLVELADQVVAATPEVAAEVLKEAGVSATVVGNADEGALDDAKSSPLAVARQWFECLKNLKMKPPHCANTNTPLPDKPKA